VLSDAKKDPMTNCPGFTDVTARPTSSTTPQYSCPIGTGAVVDWIPRYGHKSDPQMQVAESRKMASVGSTIFGVASSSRRTSRAPYRTAAFMSHVLPSYCSSVTLSSHSTDAAARGSPPA
jgi:hypothetical protein